MKLLRLGWYEFGKCLREAGETETVSIFAVYVSEKHCEFQQNAINPLFDFDNILDFCFFVCQSCEHHCCCLLVESFSDFYELVLSEVFEPDGGDACPDDVVGLFAGGDGLDVSVCI
jgi:hypothetical protein